MTPMPKGLKSELPRVPTRILGIDFSGAENAGKNIWIADGVVTGDVLRIKDCQPARLMLGVCKRDPCLERLRDFIGGLGACAVGLDFPFGLPRSIVTERNWETFALSFGNRYPCPELFRNVCWQVAGERERRRATDLECQTPFCCYNLRLYRQTFYGIRDVLAPLVRDGRACVLPMQAALPGVPWLLEICPASTLARMEKRLPYKGRGADKRENRLLVLQAVEGSGSVSVESPKLRATILRDPGGDALDSVIAALAAFQAIRSPVHSSTLGPDPSNVEGHVYV